MAVFALTFGQSGGNGIHPIKYPEITTEAKTSAPVKASQYYYYRPASGDSIVHC